VHFLRSDVAHGTIKGIDTKAAAAMPGVVRIFTGADFEGVGGLPCGWQVTDRTASRCRSRAPGAGAGQGAPCGRPHRRRGGRHLEQARDAAEAIEVGYRGAARGVDMKAALADGAPKVHDDLTDDNLCYDWGFVEENREAVTTAFEEGRACHHAGAGEQPAGRQPDGAARRGGRLQPGTGNHTLYTTSQNPHVIRLLMGAFVLGIPEHKLRSWPPMWAAASAPRSSTTPKRRWCTFAAKQLNRPVKWTSSARKAS
jgi:carbon-monoxide dehydrogenase large subunit